MKPVRACLFVIAGWMGMVLQTPSLAAEQGNVASITDTKGVVMVDQGKGFRSSKIGTVLYENDRVITLDGSKAEITFSDGCRTTLNSNNLIVINSAERCLVRVVDASKTTNVVAAMMHSSILLPATVAGAVVGGYILTKSISGE